MTFWLAYAGICLIAAGGWALLGREPMFLFIAAGIGLVVAAILTMSR